jgi:hypothetical protein
MARLISQVVLPYGQQWAASNGYPLIAKLLAEEPLHDLVARYGDSMLAAWAEARAAAAKANAGHNGPGVRAGAGVESAELQQLNARLTAIEAQHQQLLTLLETVRTKMRPLAQALGCCPECLVGIEGCPCCWGKSAVGSNPPDLELLKARIIEPLAASGVPLQLNEVTRRPRGANGRTHTRRETGANHE